MFHTIPICPNILYFFHYAATAKLKRCASLSNCLISLLYYLQASGSSPSYTLPRPTQKSSMFARDINPPSSGAPQHQQIHIQAGPRSSQPDRRPSQPDRQQRGFSQPPISPATPPPPWATQQPAPRRVVRKSQLGGRGGLSFGVDYTPSSTLPRSKSQASVHYQYLYSTGIMAAPCRCLFPLHIYCTTSSLLRPTPHWMDVLEILSFISPCLNTSLALFKTIKKFSIPAAD